MKRLLVGVIFALMLLSAEVAWADASFTVGQNTYTVDGQTYTMDAVPYLQDGRVFLPLRYVAIACGINPENICYDNGGVQLVHGSKILFVKVGENIFLINGKNNPMDVPTQMANNRTYLPARYIAEALGFNVSWKDNAIFIKNTPKSLMLEEIDQTIAKLKNKKQQLIDVVDKKYQQEADKLKDNEALYKDFISRIPAWREEIMAKLKPTFDYLDGTIKIVADLYTAVDNMQINDFTQARELLNKIKADNQI